MEAAAGGHARVADVLLARGADPARTDAQGLTAEAQARAMKARATPGLLAAAAQHALTRRALHRWAL